jgi:hypothetical protein
MKRIVIFLVIFVFLAAVPAMALNTDTESTITPPPSGGNYSRIYNSRGPQGPRGYTGAQGAKGEQGEQGRHGFAAYVDLLTGFILKAVPVSASGITDEKGNKFVVIGKISGKELEELRDSVGTYSILKPSGELLIYNMQGELRKSFKNADTVKLAQSVWGPIKKGIAENKERSLGNARVNKAQDGQITDLQSQKADRTQLGWAGWWYWVILGIIVLIALLSMGLSGINFSFGAQQPPIRRPNPVRQAARNPVRGNIVTSGYWPR